MVKKIVKKQPKKQVKTLPMQYAILALVGVVVMALTLNITLKTLSSVSPQTHPTATVHNWQVPLPTLTQIPSRTPLPIFKTTTPVKTAFSLPTATMSWTIQVWPVWEGKVIYKPLNIRPQPYASGANGYVNLGTVWEFDAIQAIEWRTPSGKLLYKDIWWRLTGQKHGWLPEMLNQVRYMERVE